MLAEIDMHDDKAVRDTLVLFRPLDGNVRAEVEHHNTRYTKDLCRGTKTILQPVDRTRLLEL